MRAYTTFHAVAILALANLIAACGPEIVTVEKTVIVEKPTTVFVCMDEAHTRVEPGQSCPDAAAPAEVILFACPGSGAKVEKAEDCGTVCREGYAYDEYAKACVKPEQRDCAAGLYLNAQNACVPVPAEGVVAINKTRQGIEDRPEIPAGGGAMLLSLTANSGHKPVRLDNAAYILNVAQDPRGGGEPDWDDAFQMVQDYVESCTLSVYAGPGTGRTTAPAFVHDEDGYATVSFFPAFAFTGQGTFDLSCQTKTGTTAPFLLSAHFSAVGMVDTDTGEYPIVAFGDMNFRNGSYAVVSPAPVPAPCAGIRVTLASGSPAGAAVPGFSEALRYNVTVPLTCNNIAITTVQNTIVNTGWYAMNEQVRVVGTDDPTLPLLTDVSRWQPDTDGIVYTSDAPGESDDAVVGSGNSRTFSFRLDSSHASDANHDALQVKITGFCYKDTVTGVEACLDQSAPIVIGGTLVF